MSHGDFEQCPFVGAASSNFYPGRRGMISRIVIHTTQGSFDSAVQWFLTPRVPPDVSSAHMIIRKDGYLVQSVRESDTAFAAPTANADGLHIELEGNCYDPQGLFPEKQMVVAVRLAAHWCKKYAIAPDRLHILGHYQINPGYRDDPGPYFPWQQFMKKVAEAAGAPPPNLLWMHEDGLKVVVNKQLDYGVRWPKGAHHAYVTIDGKWPMWHGKAAETVPMRFLSGGRRHALLQVYNASSKQIASDDLIINVG